MLFEATSPYPYDGMNPMNIHVRAEAPADAAAIDTLTVAAFLDAPHTSHTEQCIIKALRSANALTISLVAEMSGEIVGHVAISPVTVSDGALGWFGLGPVSVLPTHQGHGIGSGLVREALRRLEEQGGAGCVVLGEPAYYSRFGFRQEPGLLLPEVPQEYFQALPFGRSVPCGAVSYHEAFAAQE